MFDPQKRHRSLSFDLFALNSPCNTNVFLALCRVLLRVDFNFGILILTDLLTQSTEATAKEPFHPIDLPDLCFGLFRCISRYLSKNV